MTAIVQERFGPPDVLQLVDIDLPEAGAGEVLVQAHAAALNPYDWHIMRGDPLTPNRFGDRVACWVRQEVTFVSDFAVAAGGHRRRYLPGCFLDDLGSGGLA